MSNNSDSESESFDPMKSRVKEFVYYKQHKEMKAKERKEKEECKYQRPQDYSAESRNDQNSKKPPADSTGAKMSQGKFESFNCSNRSKAFHYEQGQNDLKGILAPITVV